VVAGKKEEIKAKAAVRERERGKGSRDLTIYIVVIQWRAALGLI
jgi:hypothetical protein